MKTYNFKKAKQLINENAENLAEASLGMLEDWAGLPKQFGNMVDINVNFQKMQMN